MALSQISSACNFSEEQAGTFELPQTCTPGCAESFLPWLQQCSWEEEIGGQPSWVWKGFGSACSATLDTIITECDVDIDAARYVWSVSHQCDGSCDCPSCDDEVGCNYPISICPDNNRCACNSGATIPFAWVCDGVNDCAMEEDESAASCGLKGFASIDIFAATVQVSGRNRHCANRWSDEVEANCVATDVASSQRTCSSSCAAAYLPWFLDCKGIIVDSSGNSQSTLTTELNRHFMCCMDGSCTPEQYNSLVGCDDSTAGLLENIADGDCAASQNCPKFARDGGDCEKRTLVRVPYSVTGAVGPDEFAAALTDDVSWLSVEDVLILHFRQVVTGSIVISSPTIAAVYMSQLAPGNQLRTAISTWLRVPAADVAIDNVNDLYTGDQGRRRRRLQRESHSVRVVFTVVSGKDITAPFKSDGRHTVFREILNEATPRVIDQLVASIVEDNVRIETPIVETEIICDVVVGYAKYELINGVQLAHFVDLASEIRLVTTDRDRIEQSLSANCFTNLCATTVLVQPDGITVERADPGSGNSFGSVSLPVEDETSIADAAIVVVGGAICAYALIACLQHRLKKMKSQTLVVYSDGRNIGNFENIADELQLQVLERLVARWKTQEESKTEAIFDANKDALASSGNTITMLECPLLVPETNIPPANDGSPPRISEVVLMAAIDADRSVSVANRSTLHQEAHARLASARATIAASQRATLQNAGIDVDVIEELQEETSALDEDGDRQIDALNARLDQTEIQMLKVQGDECAKQLARAETELKRHDIQDQYNIQMTAEFERLAKMRAQEHINLCEILMARRSALAKAHEDSLIEAVLENREQDEQDRTTLQHILADMRQKHDAGNKSLDCDEKQDAMTHSVLRSIVLEQNGRCSAEIDYWLYHIGCCRGTAQAVAEVRKKSWSEAHDRLVKARSLLAEKAKAALVANGMPVALIEQQLAETAAVEIEQDEQREDFEADLDQKEHQQVLSQTIQFEAEMDACDSLATQEKLAASYSTGMAVTHAHFEAVRAEERAKLHARLGKRKQMLVDQHAGAIQATLTAAADVLAAARSFSVARAEAEARTIALTNTAPEQSECMQNLNNLHGATTDDKSLAGRRDLLQERLVERRQELADKHRKELVLAGVPADVVERHMNALQVNDSLSDGEVENLETAAEMEQKKNAEAEAQVAQKRMGTRKKLQVELRSRRAALETKQRAELGRIAPAGASKS